MSPEIVKHARTLKDAAKIIYAYGTKVTPKNSLEEIEKIIQKFNAIGFQFTRLGGECMIRFGIEDPEYGIVPIQIDVPRILLKTDKNEKYLENESWRLVVLDLKNRVYRLNESANRPMLVLADRIVTRDGRPMMDTILETGAVRSLLPPATKKEID